MPTSLLIKDDRHDGARSLQRSDHLAALATQSLIAEAELTPKAGLVIRGCDRVLYTTTGTSLAITLRSFSFAIR
jgi:hypothetical protein